MTRFVYDQFAKQYLQQLLSPLGEVETSRDVASEVRQMDVVFIPKTSNQTVVRSLGWLGEMAATPAIFEPFRNPVTADEIRSCLSKLFNFQAELNRVAAASQNQQAKREGKRTDTPRCHLWILTPTASDNLLAQFGATLKGKDGVHHLVEGLQSTIVVIHQLPRTPETLWLRLLGRGTVQKQAIAEFNALPKETPFKDSILEVLSNLFSILQARQDLDSQDRELVMELSPLYLERIQTATEQGIERGIERVAIRLLNRRLGSLSPELDRRVRSLPVDRLEDLTEALLDFESEADLIEWLDRL